MHLRYCAPSLTLRARIALEVLPPAPIGRKTSKGAPSTDLTSGLQSRQTNPRCAKLIRVLRSGCSAGSARSGSLNMCFERIPDSRSRVTDQQIQYLERRAGPEVPGSMLRMRILRTSTCVIPCSCVLFFSPVGKRLRVLSMGPISGSILLNHHCFQCVSRQLGVSSQTVGLQVLK